MEDLFNGSSWKVVHLSTHRHVWDLPEIEENNDLFSPNSTTPASPNFELVVELPNIESISYQREDAPPTIMVDDEIISIVETDDEDIDEDIKVDNTIVEYVGDEDSDDLDDEQGDVSLDV